jgi:hypothetical protein
VAVAKEASCVKSPHHAGSSWAQSKVNEEEFDLQQIKDGAETSDSFGPPNPSPGLARQDMCSQQMDALNLPVKSKSKPAHNLIHFFDGFDHTPGKHSLKSKGEAPERKICKLQGVKKLSQCLAVSERWVQIKSDKITKNMEII